MENIEHWPIDKFIEYARNPRKNDHAIDRIASAINEFGFKVPIIAKSDGSVVDGHLRLKAARKLKLDTLPVLLADDLTDAQIKAFRLSINKMAEIAEWDDELLALELEELQDLDFDMGLIGFDTDELDALLQTDVEGLTDDDAVPELQEEAISKRGDVWLLGNHRVMCGDSTSVDDVEKLMDGKKADMVFTDPPYNVDYEGKTIDSLKIKNDKMNNLEFSSMLTSVFNNLYLTMQDGAPIYVTCPLEDGVFHSAFLSGGLKLQSILIWLKNTMVMGRKDYHYKHEPILYGWKEGGAHYWQGGRDKTSIIECNKPPRNGVHPTMKPIELIEILLGNSGRVDAIVSDLFGGSGSTLIACEKTNRNCRMMELDEKYCDVIIRRWQEWTGKDATLESTGETFNQNKQEAA